MFNIDINEWQGRRSLQLIVKDIRPSEAEKIKAQEERQRFCDIWNGAAFDASENVIPNRDDFATVYRFFSTLWRMGSDTVSHRDIVSKLSLSNPERKIGYIKLKIIVKVFQEFNLVGIEETEDEVYKFRVQYTTTKSDLEKSSLIRRLRSQMK